MVRVLAVIFLFLTTSMVCYLTFQPSLGKIWHTGKMCLVVCFIKKKEAAAFRDTHTLIHFCNSMAIYTVQLCR